MRTRRPRAGRGRPARRVSAPSRGVSAGVWVRLSDEQLESVASSLPLFGLWLADAGADLRQRAEAGYGDEGLSRALLHALVVLASLPAGAEFIPGTTIAYMVGFSQYTAARILRTLAAVGLLERHPEAKAYRLPQ